MNYKILAGLGVALVFVWRLLAYIEHRDAGIDAAGYARAVAEYESAANSAVELELYKLLESQDQQLKQLALDRDTALQAAKLDQKRNTALLGDLEKLRSINEPLCSRIADATVGMLNAAAKDYNADSANN